VQLGFSQVFHLEKKSCDCDGALTVTDTVVKAMNSPFGVGKKLEKYYYTSYEGEKNSVWYKITMPEDCYFTFDLIPFSIEDDYDFALYKYTGYEKKFCKNIRKRNIAPLREIISEDDKTIASRTGLTLKNSRIFAVPGPGESYGNAPKVKKGDVYYLLVNNVEYGQGHTIHFHFKISTDQSEMDIEVVDAETEKPLKTNLNISTTSLKYNPPKADSSYMVNDVSELQMNTGLYEKYTIAAFTKGYFTSIEKVYTGDSAADRTVKIEMQKIKKDVHLVLDNVDFNENSSLLKKESYKTLELLAENIRQNPLLKIEIQGHVSFYDSLNNATDTAGTMKLSEDRAKAVYNYLLQKGISENKMIFKGYGNTKVIFLGKVNAEGRKKNNRIELRVISNN
jgi:outer membrane protein OmpA-like peptidoglycan-associated protein